MKMKKLAVFFAAAALTTVTAAGLSLIHIWTLFQPRVLGWIWWPGQLLACLLYTSGWGGWRSEWRSWQLMRLLNGRVFQRQRCPSISTARLIKCLRRPNREYSISLMRPDMSQVLQPGPVSYTHLDVYKRQGFGQGIQPLLGYCVGAGMWRRFKQVMKCSILCSFGLSAVMTIICYFFVNQIVSVFLTEASAFNYAARFARILLCTSCLLYTSRCV